MSGHDDDFERGIKRNRHVRTACGIRDLELRVAVLEQRPAAPPAEDRALQGSNAKTRNEWPKMDSGDAYYDIEDFFKDLRRMMMLASGGSGYPPRERLEMLRDGLQGAPLVGA